MSKFKIKINKGVVVFYVLQGEKTQQKHTLRMVRVKKKVKD